MLYEGALALQQGDKERARELLLQVVEADENAEEAWLWLSGAVDDPEDQRTALENVLALNPENRHARYGLAVLDGKA
jgi:thioredoxin-like negative regulator of GroEL